MTAPLPNLYKLEFDGTVLVRGFWLYVWEIVVGDGTTLHYVGKTGDKASGVSQSPFDRLSKHLGYNHNNNALRRHLGNEGLDPERCRFRFRAYGPLFGSESRKTHGELCDVASGLESALANAMVAAGYPVINIVNCRMLVDPEQFATVRAAFAVHFDKLGGAAREVQS